MMRADIVLSEVLLIKLIDWSYNRCTQHSCLLITSGRDSQMRRRPIRPSITSATNDIDDSVSIVRSRELDGLPRERAPTLVIASDHAAVASCDLHRARIECLSGHRCHLETRPQTTPKRNA